MLARQQSNESTEVQNMTRSFTTGPHPPAYFHPFGEGHLIPDPPSTPAIQSNQWLSLSSQTSNLVSSGASLVNSHRSIPYNGVMNSGRLPTGEESWERRLSDSKYGRGSPWLQMYVLNEDGGSQWPEYSVSNLLADNAEVYCTRKKCNANVIMGCQPHYTSSRYNLFTIAEVYIRIPRHDFTSPLKNGFLFVCSEEPYLNAFDEYDLIDSRRLLDDNLPPESKMLPKVLPCVKTVLYFQLDPTSDIFTYRFQKPISGAKYLFFKFLGSFGSRENIDIEFIGIKGRPGPLTFPEASLL